ncbi:molybdopterin-dependent oxidoreductase, partial [Aureimonas sp. AU4]|uniref:molybdopterin-dependent oxidoreductase n=1 Tax=Aureimonas sp. AU4 TaxID=1638163 RepID=UPI000A52B266
MTDPAKAGGGERVLRSLSHWGAFRAQVENGRLVGVLPFEHDPAPSELISVWPEMLRSPLRIARPAVRRGWLAGDGGAGRGSDEYREVPWDEALDLAAGEIGRVRERHGNAALFAGSYGWSSAGRLHHARTLVRRFFGAIGGFTDQVTNYSYGAAMAFLPRILGVPDPIGDGAMTAETIRDHCDVMLAFGGLPQRNWEVVSGGFGRHAYPAFMAALAQRVRLVAVTPFRGDVPSEHPCEWLAPRPNTDTALILALSQTILAAGLHDEAFLASHCHGFGTYRAYLLGESDGVPKTAEWAAAITGLEAADIRQLALSLPGRRVLLTASWSLQRARHGEQPYWAIVALAAMLGQIGLPGGGFVFGYGSSNSMGNPRFETPLFGLPVGPNPVGIAIPVARVADLLLNPGDTVRFDGREITYPDIRLVYWAGGNPFHHHQDLNRLRKAFRRPETVIVNEGFWTATARHADIVFPATVAAEREDIGGSSRDPFILAMHKLVEPAGEARNDFAIFAGLAERLGSRDAFTGGRTEREWLHHAWAQIASRLKARGMTPPSFETFWETGFLEVDRPREGDRVPFAAFRADPVANRLATRTGRIEIGSPAVADFASAGLPSHPAWLDPEEWLGSPLARTYPIHLLTPQPARRLHGQMDWSAVSAQQKTDGRERVAMHPADARARGIGEGDLVRLFNDRGACLAVAALSEDVRPGVALLPTGATFDPDGRGDRNSNPNVLTRDIGTSELGQGCSAQSCLVEIEPLRGPAPPLRIHEPPSIVGLGETKTERRHMSIAFDHLILLVHDLDAAARDFQDLGFTVTERQDAVEGAR